MVFYTSESIYNQFITALISKRNDTRLFYSVLKKNNNKKQTKQLQNSKILKINPK